MPAGLSPSELETWLALQNAAVADGEGIAQLVDGYGAVIVEISGTFVATVTFEANAKKGVSNWTAVPGISRIDGARASAPTAGGIWVVPTSGLDEFRARISGWVSGSVTVRVKRLGYGSVVDIGDVEVVFPPGALTVTQGNKGTNAQAWWVEIGDTTSGPAAISTAGADGVSNTRNTLSVDSRLEVFNGTTWDRAASGDKNNVATIVGVADTLPLGRYNATRPTITDGRYNARQVGSLGALDVGLRNPDASGALMPASALLADGATVPTTTSVGAALLSYNGTTADLVRSGDKNNVATIVGILDALTIGRYNATRPTITDGRYNAAQIGALGALDVSLRNLDASGALFPATAALADATSNPTLTAIQSFGMSWQPLASTWARNVSTWVSMSGLATQGAIAQTGLLGTATGLAWGQTGGVNKYTGWWAAENMGDANVGSGYGAVAMAVWNGASWDKLRGNIAAVGLASAARTTTQNISVTNYNHHAIIVVLDMTAVGSGPSVTVSITTTDANGITRTLLTGAAIVTVSNNVYKIGPALAAVANAIAQDYLPRTLTITVTANNANSGTYSVSYELV